MAQNKQGAKAKEDATANQVKTGKWKPPREWPQPVIISEIY